MVLKTFRLGPKLRYPITITKLLRNKNEPVAKQESLLEYTYKHERLVGDPELGEERVELESLYAEWDCPTEGSISQWKVKVGDRIEQDQIVIAIDETCPHDQQYAGLCVLCGKDMKESNWASETLDTDRATIAMVHDNAALTVSTAQATRTELDLQQRLLEQRKLSLVVDLDQTIIHACIEPTVGEWQRDPANPNYEAVKDVRAFQLDDGPRGLTSGCWYYIKQRPGLADFLQKMNEMFEMHIYTMGTRAYAEQIANIVDPEKKLFGHRIISRDENGSMTAKSLQRLFPVSTNMVVVIDDRADVWPRNRKNLIKVTPYDFFKGIGDINSSFLPKREDLLAPSPIHVAVPVRMNGNATQPPLAAPEPAKNGAETDKGIANSSDETAILQLQAEEQERELEKQFKERPLLHMQEELDKEESTSSQPEGPEGASEDPKEKSKANGDHSETPVVAQPPRHNLLRDDDEELAFLEQHLTDLHRTFYKQYDARRSSRHSHLTGSRRPPPPMLEVETIPDAGFVLDRLKAQVLRGCRIVLSGLVPMGVEVEKSETGLQIMSFGADLRTKIGSKVTHLVVSKERPRTQKVRQAAKVPKIKIVNQDWLAACITRWQRLDEGPFLVELHPADRRKSIQLGQSATDAVPGTNGNGDLEDESAVGSDDDDEVDAESVDTGDEDGEVHDEFGVMPTDLRDGERSPVDDLKKMDWGDMDDELAEFMGSEVDTDEDFDASQLGDDDDDTTGSDASRKRKSDHLGDEDDGTASTLAKKQKLAKSRTTGLRNVENVEDESEADDGGSVPQAEAESQPVAAATIKADAAADEDDEDDDLDLEAELEAEMEAEEAENEKDQE